MEGITRRPRVGVHEGLGCWQGYGGVDRSGVEGVIDALARDYRERVGLSSCAADGKRGCVSGM